MDTAVTPGTPRPLGILRNLTCAVCGDDAGRHHQHWNRDDGFGICRRCVDWLMERGTSADEILRSYGTPGLHYAAKGA